MRTDSCGPQFGEVSRQSLTAIPTDSADSTICDRVVMSNVEVNPIAQSQRFRTLLDFARHQNVTILSHRFRAFPPFDETLDLGGEFGIRLKNRRVENDRQHSVDEPARVCGIVQY